MEQLKTLSFSTLWNVALNLEHDWNMLMEIIKCWFIRTRGLKSLFDFLHLFFHYLVMSTACGSTRSWLAVSQLDTHGGGHVVTCSLRPKPKSAQKKRDRYEIIKKYQYFQDIYKFYQCFYFELMYFKYSALVIWWNRFSRSKQPASFQKIILA